MKYSHVIQGNTHIFHCVFHNHYSDVIINAMASQITGVSIVYSTVCLGLGLQDL